MPNFYLKTTLGSEYRSRKKLFRISFMFLSSTRELSVRTYEVATRISLVRYNCNLFLGINVNWLMSKVRIIANIDFQEKKATYYQFSFVCVTVSTASKMNISKLLQAKKAHRMFKQIELVDNGIQEFYMYMRLLCQCKYLVLQQTRSIL